MATKPDVRTQAVELTYQWWREHPNQDIPKWDDMLAEVRQMSDFLSGPVTASIVVRVGLVREQGSGDIADPQPGGSSMQLTDSQEVDYTLAGYDKKGHQVTGDTFNASSSDESVATVNDQGTTFTVVAGDPGSAVITFKDSDSDLSVTEAIDVVTGDTATIQVQAGTPREQGDTPGGGGTTPPPVDGGGTTPPPVDGGGAGDGTGGDTGGVPGNL